MKNKNVIFQKWDLQMIYKFIYFEYWIDKISFLGISPIFYFWYFRCYHQNIVFHLHHFIPSKCCFQWILFMMKKWKKNHIFHIFSQQNSFFIHKNGDLFWSLFYFSWKEGGFISKIKKNNNNLTFSWFCCVYFIFASDFKWKRYE